MIHIKLLSKKKSVKVITLHAEINLYNYSLKTQMIYIQLEFST